MGTKRTTLKSSLKRMQLDRTSLQLRLTAGITTIALLGVGAIGTWTTWQMRQMLLVDHKKDLKLTAYRLNQQLAGTQPARWQETMNQWAAKQWPASGLWVAAKQPNGETVAEIGRLNSAQVDATRLIAAAPWSEITAKPTVQAINGRQLVLCRYGLRSQYGPRSQTATDSAASTASTIANPLGELYLARDITHDYRVLSTLINTLLFAALLALALIMALIAMYVRRSLQPLRQINQLAVVQASKPRALLLTEQPVPREMQGFVQAMGSLTNHLIESGERQREFTNSLSHELRTSLSLIQGYVQRTLRQGDNLTSTQREALQVAASEADRTVQLLQDLLDLGRMNCGKTDCCLKPLVLNDLIESTILQADPQREHQIELVANRLVVVKADMRQLTRVLLHLLKNAKQYSKPDQPILVKLSQDKDIAILQVSDSGCGIPVVDQPHVFEPFYRVEASRCRSTGGMGLGLAIVKALVEGMGGEVSLDSTPGKGSTFTIHLPAEPCEPIED